MIQYKIYRKDNYIFVVNNSTQETQYGFVKEVFIDKSNINTPNYRIFNVRDFNDQTILNINQILKEDGSAYTTTDFEDFRNKNTGNFNQGGSGQGVQTVTGSSVDNTDPSNPIINAVEEAPEDGNTYGRQDGTWVQVTGGSDQDLQSVMENGSIYIDSSSTPEKLTGLAISPAGDSIAFTASGNGITASPNNFEIRIQDEDETSKLRFKGYLIDGQDVGINLPQSLTTGEYTVALEQEELTDDFYIATQIASSKLLYKTDIYREIDIQPFAGSLVISNTNEIVRNGNNLYLTGNYSLDSSLQAFFCKLSNCKVVSNILLFDNAEFTNISSPVHSLVYHNNFCYLATRTTVTTITKINPNDLNDKTSLNIPNTAGFAGQTTDLLGYRNKLYILATAGTNTVSYFVEIDTNLINYRSVFSVASTANIRTFQGIPFLIYNDEIYIVWSGTTTTLTVQVYDFQGNLKRQALNLVVNVDITLGSQSYPHWLGIFNDRLLVSTVYAKTLARINCNSLALEDSIAITTSVTDDNSITSNGYILLNGEKNPYDLTPVAQLLKVKYNNFSDLTVEQNPFNSGNGSYGSLGTYPRKESLNTLPVSSIVSGIVNNVALQELGGVDKNINSIRIGKGNSNVTSNTVLGTGSLSTNTTGDSNTAIGLNTLNLNTIGRQNTALGATALAVNISGTDMVAIGTGSLGSNTTGNFNVGLGSYAGYGNTTGVSNLAIGTTSLLTNSAGSRNVAIGTDALRVTTSNDNIAIGFSSGSNTTGSGNIIIGSRNTGGTNTGISTGSNNVIIAPNSSAVTGITTGSGNVSIGMNTGLTAASSNTVNIADGIGNKMFVKATNGEITAPNLTTTLITSGGVKSLVTKEYIDNNVITNTVSATATLAVVSTGKVNYHTFTGTTSTYTAPAITGNTTKRVVIINQGTGDITLNSNTGANDIWESGVLMNSLLIPKDTTVSLYNNGVNWSVLGA